MTAKHTPNWELHLARLAPEAPIFGFSIRASGKEAPITSAGVYVDAPLIADFVGGYTAEEVEANAYLIAASPLLYEALLSVVDLVDRGVIHIKTADREEFLTALTNWNSTIAKAEGNQ